MSNIKRSWIGRFIKRKPWLLPVIFLFFLFYLFTFQNTHPWNQAQYFIRNKLLVYFTVSIWRKAVFFLPIVYSLLSLSVIKLQKKEFYLLYPFTFIYLLPLWLVEQRYYMVPFVFFLIFRNKLPAGQERLLFAYQFLLSIFIFWGIAYGKFFL